MATSLLLLLDDIASVLDDVGVMTKAATAKTAGVIGDDLALTPAKVGMPRGGQTTPPPGQSAVAVSRLAPTRIPRHGPPPWAQRPMRRVQALARMPASRTHQ